MSAGHIMIVDDQAKIRRFMRSTLVAEGYEVNEAKTGEAALEGMRELRPDLVVLDMNMPGMGGLAACREIRKDSDVAITSRRNQPTPAADSVIPSRANRVPALAPNGASCW